MSPLCTICNDYTGTRDQDRLKYSTFGRFWMSCNRIEFVLHYSRWDFVWIWVISLCLIICRKKSRTSTPYFFILNVYNITSRWLKIKMETFWQWEIIFLLSFNEKTWILGSFLVKYSITSNGCISESRTSTYVFFCFILKLYVRAIYI